MIYIGYILLIMLMLRFMVVLTNMLSKPFLPKTNSGDYLPKVSVLIPARNEETNLPNLLSDLSVSVYPNLEVIVCNDHSTDGTSKILSDYQEANSNFKWFLGEKLPEGWVGKNYACHQLAQRATGDYLLYLDADVRVSALLINYLVSFAYRRKLALLSVFPQQQIISNGEWCTVPIMNWILLSFLPLPLVRMRWFPSLSAANGQVMFFETKSYQEHLWHQMVKGANVEDITIARMVKKKKLRLAVLLGSRDVSCRMYTEYNEAVNGFARNIHQYFGGSRCWMFFFVLISWIRVPALFFLLSPWFALLAFVIELIMRGQFSYLSRQPIGKNYRFYFRQLLALTIIAYRNIKNNRKGFIEWKGREYQI